MNPTKPTESAINLLTTALAVSYWRGKLSAVLPDVDKVILSDMAEAAAERGKDAFLATARIILSSV